MESLHKSNKIVLFIPRNVVQQNDQAFVLNTFKPILIDQQLIRKFKNQVTIGFDGYDDDSKEVFEITEIRNYIQKLTLKFPYWFYFVSLDDGHSLRILMLILCKFRKLDDKWKVRIDLSELDTVTAHLLKQMMSFYKEHHLPEQESIPQIGRLLEAMEKIKG